MVAVTAEKLIVEFEARLGRFTPQLKRADKSVLAVMDSVRTLAGALTRDYPRSVGVAVASTGALQVGLQRTSNNLAGLTKNTRKGRADLQAFAVQLSNMVAQLQLGVDASRVLSLQLPRLLATIGARGNILTAIASAAIPIGLELFGTQTEVEAAATNIGDLVELTSKLQQAMQDLAVANGQAGLSSEQLSGKFEKQSERVKALFDDIAKSRRIDALAEVAEIIDATAGQFGEFSQEAIDQAEMLQQRIRDIRQRQEELRNSPTDGGDLVKRRENDKLQMELLIIQRAIGGVNTLAAKQVAIITKTADAFDISREAATRYLQSITEANTASTLDQQIAAIAQARNELVEAVGQEDERAEAARRTLAALERTELSLITLKSGSQAAAKGLDSAAAQAAVLADQLDRAASNAARIAIGRLSSLDRAKLENEFVGDPVGFAGAVAGAEFDMNTGQNLGRQDRQVRVQLLKERELTIKFAREEARIRENTRKKLEKLNQRGGSQSPSSPNRFAEAVDSIRSETAAIGTQTDALSELNPLVEDYGFATAKARAEQDLLTAAQQSGLEVTPELRAQIEQLATAYATAQAGANQLAASQESLREFAAEFNGLAKDALGGFIDDLRNGTSAADALENALRRIEDRLIDIALNSIFSSSGGGLFGNILGGIGGGLFGFKNGGKVAGFAAGGLVAGPGSGRSDSIPALLSNGEFVANARATKDNRPLLEAINSGAFNLKDLAGFADGGLVAEDFVARRIGNLNPAIRRAPGAAPAPVVVAPPQVNQRIINAFDENEVVSKVLDGPVGESSVLNMVRRSPSRFRGALGL